MGLFGIRLRDFRAARRQIQDRWPGRYFEIWPDVFDGRLFWVADGAKTMLEELKVPHAVRFAVPEERLPIFLAGWGAGSPDVLPAPDSVRGRALAGRGIAVALVEEGTGRPSVEPSGPEDAYFFLSRPGTGRYFVWRLLRSKDDAREYVRKHRVCDPELDAWLAAGPVERFADLAAALSA